AVVTKSAALRRAWSDIRIPAEAPTMLFPLPLTAFENYMLADDLPGQPMCFYLRLNFFGRLDQRALQAALRMAVARQPLFRARVVTLDGARHWVREHNLQPRLFWNDEAPCV